MSHLLRLYEMCLFCTRNGFVGLMNHPLIFLILIHFFSHSFLQKFATKSACLFVCSRFAVTWRITGIVILSCTLHALTFVCLGRFISITKNWCHLVISAFNSFSLLPDLYLEKQPKPKTIYNSIGNNTRFISNNISLIYYGNNTYSFSSGISSFHLIFEFDSRTLTFGGRFQVGNLDQVSLDDFAKTMAINVEGPLFMTKEIGQLHRRMPHGCGRSQWGSFIYIEPPINGWEINRGNLGF